MLRIFLTSTRSGPLYVFKKEREKDRKREGGRKEEIEDYFNDIHQNA